MTQPQPTFGRRYGRYGRYALLGLGAAAVAAGVGYLASRAFANRVRRAPDPYAGDDDVFPPDVRHERVRTSDGGDIHVVVRDPRPNGGRPARPLVLLHGIGLRSGLWRYQFLDLVDRFRVVAVETRGHGESKAGGDGYGLGPAARDVAEVFDALDLRDAIVVGHSMGGMVVMQLAADHRPVLDDRVAGLVFLATAPFLGVPASIAARAVGLADRAARWEGRRLKVPLQRFAHSDLAFVLARVGFGVDPSPTHVELTRRMLTEVPLQAFLPSGLRLLSHDAGDALRATDTPSLVIVGDHDHITPPRFSEALAGLLPDARLVELPGCGHQVMLERRHELADLLRTFDAELRARGAD
ncbi:MAG: alpha/beta fold hydrolase [Acidimicrobiales bacterium]